MLMSTGEVQLSEQLVEELSSIGVTGKTMHGVIIVVSSDSGVEIIV